MNAKKDTSKKQERGNKPDSPLHNSFPSSSSIHNSQFTIHNSLVPRLRFPEFRDAGEWEAKCLSEICRVTQGGTPDTSITNYWGGAVKWITPAEMGKGECPYVAETVRTITEVGLKNCSSELLPENSVIISTRAPIGHLAINKVQMAINQGCRGLVPLSFSNAHFIYYYLLRSKGALNDLGAGNTFKELSGSSLKSFAIALPSIPEQQKIADCLSSLDALIAAQSEKIDALKAHKKGLMQRLFPRDGETTPQLRFPEFRNAGEWEVKKLGEISDIKTGPFGTVLHESDYVEFGTPIITVEHIGELRIQGNKAPRVSDSDKVRLHAYALNEGDIVFSRVGSVDRSAIAGETEKGWLFSGRLLRLRITDKMNSPFFLNQLLKHDSTKALIRNNAVGQTMPSLNTEILKNIYFLFPSLPEQQKIADCLSSLDGLIAAQSEKIDALKAHKKGLMQQLFPAVEAV